jgi:hypothetical protein
MIQRTKTWDAAQPTAPWCRYVKRQSIRNASYLETLPVVQTSKARSRISNVTGLLDDCSEDRSEDAEGDFCLLAFTFLRSHRCAPGRTGANAERRQERAPSDAPGV